MSNKADRNRYALYTDGGAEPNPGRMAVAALLFKDGRLIDRHVAYIGQGTNNEAEYAALILGLKMAANHTREIRCFSDSKLIVSQIAGRWRIKKRHLWRYADMVQTLRRKFLFFELRLVPREHSHISFADQLLREERDRARANNWSTASPALP